MQLIDPRRRAPRAEPTEPMELVLACHERIRSFVATGTRIAAADGAPPAQVASAADGVLRYFRVALPLHEADEESSIAPRLLASPPRAAAARVEDALAAMTAEHALIHAVLDELDPLWARLVGEPGALDAVRAPLADAQRALGELFARHLEAEERVVVPALGALPPDARAAIFREIRARRAT